MGTPAHMDGGGRLEINGEEDDHAACLYEVRVFVVGWGQYGATESAVGHLHSLHMRKRLLQEGMEQPGDEWDEM